MRTSRTAAFLGGATLLIAATTALAPVASAAPVTPPVSGCPASAELINVDFFTAHHYGVPAFLDNPDNGGNHNGVVCGIRINDQAALNRFGPNGCVAHLGCFLFSDDTLTPWH